MRMRTKIYIPSHAHAVYNAFIMIIIITMLKVCMPFHSPVIFVYAGM